MMAPVIESSWVLSTIRYPYAIISCDAVVYSQCVLWVVIDPQLDMFVHPFKYTSSIPISVCGVMISNVQQMPNSILE